MAISAAKHIAFGHGLFVVKLLPNTKQKVVNELLNMCRVEYYQLKYSLGIL
jgi:hypothetical protein